MVNFKPDKQDVEQQIKRNLYYYNQQAKLIEHARTRASKVALRRNFLKCKELIIINQNMIE